MRRASTGGTVWWRRLHFVLRALLALAVMGPTVRAQAQLALADDSVRIVYWPGDEGLARRSFLAAKGPLPLPGIGSKPALSAGTIILAPNAAAFDSITGGRTPEWSAGVAIPSLRTIVLPAYASSRTQAHDPTVALRHELVHLALHDYLGVPAPRWFAEGYAVWASGEWDASAAWQIRFALLRGAAPPLDSLSLRWPASEPRARLAYLLSASAVEYLATRNGEALFAAFLDRWRSEGEIDPAMRATYLMTVDGFEREWRKVVIRRYGWLLAVAQIGFFWLFVAVVFAAVGWRRRRRDRQRIAQMKVAEEGEAWEEPADEEDPIVTPDDEPPAVDDEWRRG